MVKVILKIQERIKNLENQIEILEQSEAFMKVQERKKEICEYNLDVIQLRREHGFKYPHYAMEVGKYE